MWLRRLRHGYAKFGYATWLRNMVMPRTVMPVTPNSVTPHGYATYGALSLASLRHPASLLVSLPLPRMIPWKHRVKTADTSYKDA